MRIIGCDLRARQQTLAMLAMLDTITGEVVKRTLRHEGNAVREFYSNLPRPVTSWKNWESNVWLAIRQRFEQPSRGNKNMIVEHSRSHLVNRPSAK